MAGGGQQVALLLWKDFLIRKRKLITLGGVVWAIVVMLSLYIVRVNVDNHDYPHCSYPARALPSAGMLTFLQSFVCSVNNKCSPLDEYQEIPTYENSKDLQSLYATLYWESKIGAQTSETGISLAKLTQLQRRFAPFLTNESVLGAARAAPPALRLVATLARAADEPTFADIARNGLTPKDLFDDPKKVQSYLSKKLGLEEKLIEEVMLSQLSFQGCLHAGARFGGCQRGRRHCDVNLRDRQLNVIESGSTRPPSDGLLIDALYLVSFVSHTVLRVKLSRLQSESSGLVTMLIRINKLMDLFEPTFGETESYKNLRGLTDTVVTTLQWLYKVITKGQLRNPIQEVTSLAVKGIDNNEADEQFHKLSEDFNDAIDALEEDLDADTSVDKVLGMLSNVANLIVKWLPKKTQHDFLFYSTLLAKLMESSNRVVVTNVNIEEIVYKVSQRNSAGIRILVELPPHTVGKIFDALTDAGRAQVLTSKINHPGQVFCDVNKLSVFFVVSQEEAKNLKSTLCKQEWKNFMTDLIKSFGVFDVKANINEMASLLVQETIGRDTSEQLYSVDKDFQVLKGFINTMMQMKKKKQDKLDWRRVLNVTKDSEFSRVVEKKASLKNQILIVLHGALANEVVKQNPILEAKISPVLIDTTEILTALNVQLESTPKKLVDEIKDTYHDILKMMLLTLLNEEKTYKSLSTHGTEIFCNNTELPHYLEFPNGTSEQHIIKICCSTFTEIDKALNTDSSLEQRAEIAKLVDETKAFWFGRRTLSRSMHLSIKVALNGFDLVDKEIFNLTSVTWQQIKQGSDSLNGLFVITDEIVKLITAIAKQNSYNSDKIPIITLMALKEILPNIPHLIVESTDIFIQDNVDIDEVVNILNADPSWPCSEKSLSKILNMSSKPTAAVKGMETILCMNRSLQTEWLEYTEAQKVRMIMSMKNLSKTEYEPHLFLKLSKNFDALVKDVDRMKEILQEIINENVTKEISKDNPTFKEAIEYSLRVIKGSDSNATFIKFLRKADKVFESTKTPSEFDGMSPHALWESYLKCSNVSYMDANCKLVSRATWLFTLKFFSVALNDVAQVVSNYFSEVSGPNATIIQILGFNRNTGLYILYEKMAGFIGVLLNSYWDLGFLNQIRRASKSMFWDCQAIVDAMVIPPGSLVTSEDIRKVKPYVCPSILYWISLPRGENSFLDIVAKPQNYFYNTPVQNLTSSFESAYVNTMELSNSIANLTKANRTDIDKQLTKIEDQFENFVDQVLSWHVSEHDPSFRLFAEINRKQFVSTIYLTRVTVTVKKLADEMDVLKISDISDNLTVNETKKLESELSAIQRLFRRSPADVIALHFDLITDLLWKNDEGYQLVDSVVTMCGNLENNVTSYILGEDKRTKTQICSKNYELIYAKVQDELSDVIHMSKNALINLVDVLRYDEEDVSSIDPFAYINKRTKVVKALQHLVKHADDLGLALYVKYLQSILDHYNVVLSYLTGEDWWDALRKLYHGRYADSFFETLAKSFEIAEDILMHLDKIRIVRLLRDVNFNDTATFCQNNITLSEYLPDSTGYLSLMKQQLCAEDKIELFRELPLLTLASQGYDNELKLPKYVNYTIINEVINELQSRLDRLKEGPKTPLNPPWIQERPQQLKQTMLKLFSKESLTKVAFGLIGNIVDASTLFLNSSHCDLCSSFTTWFKQLNLQLFKKQEYDNLLCHLHEMAPEEIYQSLKNDFHWDMALKELISTRNYTKYELNKSINDFLEQVKLHLLEDISSQSLKLADCLANGISRNVLGNVTLFTSLISKSLQLVRVSMPHVHEVEGIKSVSFFERLSKEVAPRLRVAVPLKSVLIDESEFIKKIEEVDNGLPKVFEGASIDMPDTKAELQNQLRFVNDDWKDICNANNCTRLLSIIRENLNKTASAQLFSRLQMEKFWKFDFIVDILRHLENFLSHLSRLLGVASDVDLVGLYKGRIDAHLDFILQVLQQETTNVIQESLQGMITELHPLLDETPLQFDLNALSNGLRALMQFKSSLITNGYFKIGVEELFVSEEKIESRMNSMGINNTNFWSIAAPRIGVGYIDIKPLLNAKTKNVHIRNFVCQTEEMAKVIHPANVDVVTLDDVYGAVVEQFCDVSDRQARQIIPILIENLNFTFLVDKVMNAIKTELFLASNLTTEEGESVFSKYGQLMSLMPTLQENIGDIADTLFKEPLFSALKNYGSLNGLLSSSEFLASAGNMICGQPFVGNSNKFYKAIAETRDFSTGVDPLQIEVLPTDFCRSLYKDVLSMSGGKIVWSFIKPLIMGQILYTPAAPAVQAIIQKTASAGMIGSRCDAINFCQCKFATDRGYANWITDRSRGTLRRSTVQATLEQLTALTRQLF
ncbi:ATP-binding cassette sub-family A member 13 [Eumeta japonica]|uniref:ATP-binding cassette sub-family A member 13 n=1 Tax=Eumeta variegata TaxID=151549 RepID=A0A4C1VV05_EUMVA|nr:ATP-binding cassette sub-family A member 13 [Eumeta japonica]